VHKVAAVILAGGKGSRMGGEVNKQYLPLLDKPIIVETLLVFQNCPLIDEMVLVVPKGDIEKNKAEIVEKYGLDKVQYIVESGHERQYSVFNGLKPLLSGRKLVVIHDGVRPLLDSAILEKAVLTGLEHGAVAVGLPVKDSIKQVEVPYVIKDVPRENLWAMQTPQVFPFDMLWPALQKAMVCGFAATDDAGIVEWDGHKVMVIEGNPENIKITDSHDLKLAKYYMEQKACASE
jgi:2-C-methyl-D-erythritol 4-phosphate cytidylyltransferase